MLFTDTSTGGFYGKPYSSPVLKILTKILRTRKLDSIHEYIAFCRTEKLGQKTRQKLESENTQVYAKKPRLKM
jgi:hypothetical protein